VHHFIHIIEAAVLVFVLNLPFGYWRANVKKFSFQWLLAIHIPVPIVITIRLLSGIGFDWYSFPVFILGFFLGQFLGGKIHQSRKQNHDVTSCLIMDFFKTNK
jgi:hypothetical protein